MDGRIFLPTVAWSFKVRDVIFLTPATVENPATFRCTAIPFDSSDPGANAGTKEIGSYVTDNVGNIYTVIGTGTHTVDLSDDFRCGVGPQTGKWAVLSKSVGNGEAPFLTPIHYRRLDKSAIDNIRRIELDILWKNDGIKTGFIDKDNIVVSYNWTNRTITLSGDLSYKFNGISRSLGTAWVSTPHANTVGRWFLYSDDGKNFIWSNLPWKFSYCMVAMVNYKASAAATFAIRECHGTMDVESHEELHQTQGTYLDPTNGGALATIGTYAINTATDAATTLGFDQAVVKDEDLRTIIPALAQGLYTTMKIGAGSIAEFNIASLFPFISAGSYLQVNNPFTGSMTDGINNRFYNVYQCLIPTTSDLDSQKYRMVMMQPQQTFTSQLAAEAEDVNSLLFGDLTNLTAEFKVFARLTYQTASGDSNTGKCRLMNITYVAGTRTSSFNVGGILPVVNPFVLEFTNTNTPNIPDYTIYAPLYGQYPVIKMFEIDISGNRIERTEKPYFTVISNLITAVSFGELPDAISGFILISKT